MDFTGEHGPTAALDLGCAVGGATFELASAFEQTMKKEGWMHYKAVMEGDISTTFTATVSTMKKEGWMHYKAVMEGDISATSRNVSKDTDMDANNVIEGGCEVVW
eukprot:gene14856-20916_t